MRLDTAIPEHAFAIRRFLRSLLAHETAAVGPPRRGWSTFQLLVVAIAFVLVLTDVSAAATPTEEVRGLFTSAKKIVAERRPGDRPEEIHAAIAKLIRERLAIRRAAEAALGAEWAQLTDQQRDEFTRHFGRALEHAYMGAIKALIDITRLPRFVGEQVTGDSAVVSTILSGRDGYARPLEFRLTRQAGPAPDRWAIKDIVVDGVSLVENYRAQFDHILQGRSAVALLELMRDKTAALRPVPASLTASAAPPVLRDVPFEGKDFVVGESARRILDEHAMRLRTEHHGQVVIEGHADSRGTPALNRTLAMARARAVRDYLVARGIDAGRLTTVSRGSAAPLCREEREDCWARNRRVQLRMAE